MGKSIHELNNNSKFVISSTYGTESPLQEPFDALLNDVDELANKPRRFFDTLRILVSQNATPKEREYLLECVDLWASAVETGVFEDVLKHALRKPDAKCLNDFLNTEVSDKPYDYEEEIS